MVGVVDVVAVVAVVAVVGVVDVVGVVAVTEEAEVVDVVLDPLQADTRDKAATTAPPVVAPMLCKNCRRDTFRPGRVVFFI